MEPTTILLLALLGLALVFGAAAQFSLVCVLGRLSGGGCSGASTVAWKRPPPLRIARRQGTARIGRLK
jgi:hypothetical protein